MTSEQLAELIIVVWGAGLALALDWIPGLRERWDQLTANQKRLWMAVFIVGFGVLYFVGGCYGLLGLIGLVGVTCDLVGAWVVVQAILLAAGVNQGVHQFTNRRKIKANIA
jgi:hypothetical protein